MKILVATSETAPLAKTGGLADVCGSLPKELAALGHEPVVIMPAFRGTLDLDDLSTTPVDFTVPVGQRNVYGRLLKTHLPDSDVPVYLVEQPHYFDRPELYGERGQDYADNCERFVFFCRAVMESLDPLGGDWDVIHANDWQTGLIPAYLKIEYAPGRPASPASLFTIHNMAYQGQFWHWDMLLTGLDWKYFNWQQMEFYGKLNLLKTGIVFADAVSTVSPRYAEEIQGPEHGFGLDGVVRSRRRHLHGIVNGVDYREWDPEHDELLPANFSADSLQPGKAECKRELQREFGLAERDDVPLIGFVGRLAEQKGIDLISAVLGHDLRCGDVQWAILGTGDPRYHEMLQTAAARRPQNVGVRIEYSNRLAHLVEAGADLFVMPSRFEPCGLNQLYSLKYGAVPVVRATGGLADTVVNAEPASIADGTATGFSFQEYSTFALADALDRACSMFKQQPDAFAKIRDAGMRADWSWRASAQAYVELYAKLGAPLARPAAV